MEVENMFDAKYEPQNYNHVEPKRSALNTIKGKHKTDKHYGVTVKIMNRDNPTEHDYLPVLRRIGDRAEFFDFVWENKTKRGEPCKLHFHGVVKFRQMPLLSSLGGYGIHTHFEELHDPEGWARYINKNV